MKVILVLAISLLLASCATNTKYKPPGSVKVHELTSVNEPGKTTPRLVAISDYHLASYSGNPSDYRVTINFLSKGGSGGTIFLTNFRDLIVKQSGRIYVPIVSIDEALLAGINSAKNIATPYRAFVGIHEMTGKNESKLAAESDIFSVTFPQ